MLLVTNFNRRKNLKLFLKEKEREKEKGKVGGLDASCISSEVLKARIALDGWKPGIEIQ